MKAIVCEMCGSQDLVKQDGMYVCQNCGTKYDTEEAKKLMVEVKVDNSPKIENWYQLARQAKETNDSESAAKYYELILQEDPQNWEANFFSVYFRAMQTKIAYIENAANMVTNCLPIVFSCIKENINDETLILSAVTEVSLRTLIIGKLLESSARETYKTSYDRLSRLYQYNEEYLSEYFRRNAAVSKMLAMAAECIENDYPNNPAFSELAKSLWKASVQYFADYVYVLDDPKKSIAQIETICTRIKKYEPDYTFPAPNTKGFPSFFEVYVNDKYKKLNNLNTSGCYIATAVYGSYNCPQVWILRRYRDNILAKTWYGRAFIRIYYSISPTLVSWFGDTEWFIRAVKPQLDKMVKRLNLAGISDTPYLDIKW